MWPGTTRGLFSQNQERPGLFSGSEPSAWPGPRRAAEPHGFRGAVQNYRQWHGGNLRLHSPGHSICGSCRRGWRPGAWGRVTAVPSIFWSILS